MLKFIQRITSTLLALALPVALLTACGGGSGTGGDNLVGGGPQGTITLSVGKSQLPAQSGSFVQPISSLYSTTVIAKAYLANGSPVPTGTKIQFMMDGGNTYSGALYPQPFETEDVTQPDGTIVKVPKAFWSYNVDAAAGQALMVFHAWDRPGTVTIRASWEDPSSKKTIVASTQIVVGSAISTGMPAKVFATLANGPVYVANQGKNDTGIIDILVTDPVGEPVSAPPAPNVKAELLNPELGATLQGVNGAVGTIVNTTTINGKAQVSLRAGTVAGVAKVRITADALDNNVENGIQSPIINDVTFSIEDGRVASLAFTGAYSEALKANRVTVPLAPGESFYDGTYMYMRIVSALAIDGLGNPVKGTRIDFSLIDSPVVGFPDAGAGEFAIGGDAGVPSPGGNLFTANGSLVGARIGDRLVIGANKKGVVPNFEQSANRDLLGSRIISTILDSNRLMVTEAFAASGSGAVPWVIGRAQYGAIGASAITNDQGVASTFLTYPATRLGQKALLTARAGNSRSINMDATYLGIAENSTMTASTTSVYAGKITPVTICAFDGIKTPYAGQPLQVSGLTSTIKLDPATPVTGSNGCATFNIDAEKYLGSEEITLKFTINGTGEPFVEIKIKPQAVGDVIVSLSGGGGSRNIEVTVYNTLGEPMPNRTVVVEAGTVTDDGNPPPAAITGFAGNPAVTDANGKAGGITVNYTGNAGDTYQIKVKILGTSSVTTVTFPY